MHASSRFVVVLGLLTMSGWAHAQYGGFSWGSRAPLGYAGTWGTMPLSMTGPRIGTYYGSTGTYGPRSVTWYTPGWGYSDGLQTGLPWHGQPIAAPPRPMPPTSFDPQGPMVARQERVRRRMETMYAAVRQERERRRLAPSTDPEVLAAGSKEKEQAGDSTPAPKSTKKAGVKRSKAKTGASLEPTRVVPTEAAPPKLPREFLSREAPPTESEKPAE